MKRARDTARCRIEGIVSERNCISRTFSMTIDIREFRSDDYEAARLLWERTDGIGLSDADSEQNIAQFLARNPKLSFVALRQQNLIGTILCGHDGRRGYIYHLAVAATQRRRGLGVTLVQRCLAALRAEGIAKCHLMVFGANLQGRGFWTRIGGAERVDLVTYSFATDMSRG